MKVKKPNVQLSENSDSQLKDLVVHRQPKTLNRVSKISVTADLIDKAHRKEIKNPAPYGYCPECGSVGVSRERRPNGNDKCGNGHTYKSSSAIAKL